jgi:hypothetical protein
VLRGMEQDLLVRVCDRLNAFNAQYQYSSSYTVADLRGDTKLLPGFSRQNLYAFTCGSKITATIGVWDQSTYKQPIVAGYTGLYRVARPLANLAAQLGLSAKLPGVGESFPYLYASFLNCEPGREADLTKLLQQVIAEWSGRGYTYLLIGAHERHPLSGLLSKMSTMRLLSTVYRVYWEDSMNAQLPNEDTIPNLEVATL